MEILSFRTISPHKFFLVLLFASLFFYLGGSVTHAQENECKENLQKAEDFYTQGRWTDAIDLIQQCLKNKNVSETEQGEAYRLLGLVYVATELEKDATQAFRNLLTMVPNYIPDPEKDPPQLQKIVEKIAKSLNPVIISISPDNVDEGEKGLLLSVKGNDFVYGSIVKFNGVNKKTTFVDSTLLKADLTEADLQNAGGYEVAVYSPILGGKVSNSVKFTVKSTGSFPWTWVTIGAGAVAAGVVAILTLGSSSSSSEPPTTSNPIADPPGRP